MPFVKWWSFSSYLNIVMWQIIICTMQPLTHWTKAVSSSFFSSGFHSVPQRHQSTARQAQRRFSNSCKSEGSSSQIWVVGVKPWSTLVMFPLTLIKHTALLLLCHFYVHTLAEDCRKRLSVISTPVINCRLAILVGWASRPHSPPLFYLPFPPSTPKGFGASLSNSTRKSAGMSLVVGTLYSFKNSTRNLHHCLVNNGG